MKIHMSAYSFVIACYCNPIQCKVFSFDFFFADGSKSDMHKSEWPNVQQTAQFILMWFYRVKFCSSCSNLDPNGPLIYAKNKFNDLYIKLWWSSKWNIFGLSINWNIFTIVGFADFLQYFWFSFYQCWNFVCNAASTKMRLFWGWMFSMFICDEFQYVRRL